MKKLLVALFILFLTPLSAMAMCGGAPTPPLSLENPQLSLDELEIVKAELKSYASLVENYRDCIDDLISSIAPSDAPAEYFDSPEYQNQFDTYVQLLDITENRMQMATERFDYLVQNSN